MTKTFTYYYAISEYGDKIKFKVPPHFNLLAFEFVEKTNSNGDRKFRILIEQYMHPVNQLKEITFKIIGSDSEISDNLKYITTLIDPDFGFSEHICLVEKIS